ncbi:MAG TPA: N-acetylneuraminate synthase family protein [Magnetospirillum sp.]|nr:N-acetylneuraminate synthase family protein [Magnetospirillum sp.]
MNFKIGDVPVGAGHPTLVVAEMAWAHDGSVDKGVVMIDAAADAGAQVINLHSTSLSDYMVLAYGAGPARLSGDRNPSSVFNYLDQINLGPDALRQLTAHARSRGLMVSTMCNDFASIKLAATDLRPEMIMVHPSCILEEAFVRAAAEVGVPLMLYVGGLKLGEIETAIEWAVAAGNDRIVLQHGFQSYPTALEDNNLRFIATLKQVFGLPVSFGDHTDGDDAMALVVPQLAVALGADVIEKHITPNRAAKGEDFEAALNPDEWKTFVAQIRATEKTLGDGRYHPLTERQKTYRGAVRKRAVAVRDLSAGAVLAAEDICYKRSDGGLYPEEAKYLIGRKIRADLPIEAPLTWDAVE